MRETITISVPAGFRKKLDDLTKKNHLNRSDIVREALAQFLARQEFRRLRGMMIPNAESRGLFTDEDVFSKIS